MRVLRKLKLLKLVPSLAKQGAPDCAARKEVGKEALGQILSVVRRSITPAHVRRRDLHVSVCPILGGCFAISRRAPA
jgi:hypothetical protein